MIRLLIADDHPLVREGIKHVIERSPDLTVTGEAGDGAGVLRELTREAPDVLVVDLKMPGTSIAELIERIRETHPDLPVLVMSVHPADVWAVPLFRAGAAGFVSKSRAPTELVEAIRRVSRGGRYVSPAVAQLLAEEVVGHDGARRHTSLSRREFQVLTLLGEGKMVKTVARILGLSPRTVSTYRARVLEKLELRTTADLIRYAVRHRLTLEPTEVVSVHDGHPLGARSRRISSRER